ncbi:putative divalent ion tolerance protein [Sphingomonas paucimobilis]|uniref:divalent-cation tolerance protein CutA n=1 Tax=Sphingobium quisquiliarum TaxID=538379 RepID=UPI0003FE1FCE|nr:divalent-cation tolerance protein CutA [Sphingobium quisquiliarum]EZP69993.1 putative divalent ion tolerance protein [Sphingomonas paucimobilis]
MSGVALVYTLFGSAERAEQVGRQMVQERLAACANILGAATSIYEWNGVMETAAEVPVLFKTAPSRRDALMQRIRELHDYDVPAILALPVDAAEPAYAKWIAGHISK